MGDTSTLRPKPLLTALAAGAPLLAGAGPAVARDHGSARMTVAAGQTQVVSQTTRLRSLTIAAGGTPAAPDGKLPVLVVNGTETGGAIEYTGVTKIVIQPGTWRGDVVIQVVDATAFPATDARTSSAQAPGSRSTGGATLVVNNARIDNTGIARVGVWASGKGEPPGEELHDRTSPLPV